jgi:6-phosphogluconolactonase
MSLEETLLPDRRRLFAALAHDLMERTEAAIRKRRKASLALPGGATPAPLFEIICNHPLAWEKVSLTLTDERWVSPQDPASNENLIRSTLLRRRAADATFVPFKTNHARPSLAVGTIEKRVAPLTPFDICLLGLGPDGHVGSLIPGAEGFEAAVDPHAPRHVAAIHAPGAAGSADRMSLTMSGILSSRRIVLLFAGQEKRNVFNEAREMRGVSPLREVLSQSKIPVHVFWSP